jgi:nucleotide-binding universal stress UspA family protein
MADRVLVPLDGSTQADHAVDLVFEEFPEATLVLLHVIDPAEASYSAQTAIPTTSEEWYDHENERATELFGEVETRASDHGIAVEHATEVGKPARTIVKYAEEEDIDHVVMGSHGREGVSRILLGSVAETVMRRSPVPVTVVR